MTTEKMLNYDIEISLRKRDTNETVGTASIHYVKAVLNGYLQDVNIFDTMVKGLVTTEIQNLDQEEK